MRHGRSETTRAHWGGEVDPAPLPGDMIDGYRLSELLGKGSSAWVYRALGPDDVPVALKVLRLGSGEFDSGLVDRFLQEGEILARIDDPHVIRLLAQGHDPAASRAYLVLEYVPGINLHRVLRERAWLDLRETSYVLRCCAQGLRAAHRLGILHRDIKPANVLVTPEGQVKLADFSVSLSLANKRTVSRGERVVGTLPYIAPEVLLYGNWSPAADMYALGCLAFRLVTGVLPFQTRNVGDLIQIHIEGGIPQVSTYLEQRLPLWAEELLEQLLAREPAQRPTAGDVVDILEEWSELPRSLTSYPTLYPTLELDEERTHGGELVTAGTTSSWGMPELF